jgi:hypothetical protein
MTDNEYNANGLTNLKLKAGVLNGNLVVKHFMQIFPQIKL